MKTPAPLFSVLVLVLAPVLAAAPDINALMREREEIERRFEREGQKIEQAREQALIPVHAKRREIEAKAKRDGLASISVASYATTGGAEGLDVAKMEQAKFDELEATNLIERKLEPEAVEPFQEQQDALERRRTLELAKFDTKMFGDAEGADKLRAQAIKKAEITAKWQEKIDALSREQRRAEYKLELERTTAINRAEAAIFGVQARSALAGLKKAREAMKAGQTPDFAAAAGETANSGQTEITKRDEAKNALETAREELQAKFNIRRTEIDNQREDELAKVEG